MGVMIEGVYHGNDPKPDTPLDGAFRRAKSTIRHWITADGTGDFPAQAGRYHLYVAWNCPWAHRTLLAHAIHGLDDVIGLSFARPRRTAEGWVYDPDGPYSDPLRGIGALHELYGMQRPSYTGALTVPVLWDSVQSTIVSNESANIIRMLGSGLGRGPDLYPAALREKIDAWNALIYPTVNNGVYRAGFARTQAAYDTAVHEVFDTLDKIEAQLGRTRYLTGNTFTEADLRLFPTLARFDVAYHTAFKCNRRRIVDYPNLWPYAREIFQMPGVAQTVNFDIYRRGYFSPSPARNPLGIVPIGPSNDWHAPHGRG